MDIYGYFTLAKALLQNSRVLGVDIQGSSEEMWGSFCGDQGFFVGNLGLFCGDLGLFWRRFNALLAEIKGSSADIWGSFVDI